MMRSRLKSVQNKPQYVGIKTAVTRLMSGTVVCGLARDAGGVR